MKVNSYDVLKEMGARNGKIYLAPLGNVLRYQKVKAGVQVTIGVADSMLDGLMQNSFCGGLILADATEFKKVSDELGKKPDVFKLRPLSEYQDDDGTVLWYHLPLQEPPYVGGGPGCGERHADGTPTQCAELLASGWLTHWSALPQVEL